jgi:hypothetical protein
MREILLIVIPLVCSVTIGIVFYVIARKKAVAIFLAMVLMIGSVFAIWNIAKNKESANITENGYVKVDTTDFIVEDYSDEKNPCWLFLYDQEDLTNDYISIHTFLISQDTYNQIVNSADFYYGYAVGYCIGYFESQYGIKLEMEEVYSTDIGTYIGNQYLDYPNTFVYEGVVNGENKLCITKFLYISDGEILIATLSLEGVRYVNFEKSDNFRIAKYRETYNGIVQVKYDK